MGSPDAAPDVRVLVRRLHDDLPVPAYAHPGDAGADLVAAEDVQLAPGQRAVVPTGVAIALPDGYAAFVHPRSGLAAKHGLSLVNAPGQLAAGALRRLGFAHPDDGFAREPARHDVAAGELLVAHVIALAPQLRGNGWQGALLSYLASGRPSGLRSTRR